MRTTESVNGPQASMTMHATSAVALALITHPSRGACILTTGLFGCIHMAQSSMSGSIPMAGSISTAALPRHVGDRHKATHKRGLLGRWIGQQSGQLMQGAFHPVPPLQC